VDKGTVVDRGFNLASGVADLHPIIDGVEYHVRISAAGSAGPGSDVIQ
jgi:hypothetical protein